MTKTPRPSPRFIPGELARNAAAYKHARYQREQERVTRAHRDGVPLYWHDARDSLWLYEQEMSGENDPPPFLDE